MNHLHYMGNILELVTLSGLCYMIQSGGKCVVSSLVREWQANLFDMPKFELAQ